MNTDKTKAQAKAAKGKTKEVAGKATGDKTTEYKGKAEKHVGKTGAVLADINDESPQHDNKQKDATHGSDDSAVLAELNGDGGKNGKNGKNGKK